MESKKLKYEFSQEEVNYLLQALNRVQIVGFQAAQYIVEMSKKLQSPLNAEELEEEQLELLKLKREQKTKK